VDRAQTPISTTVNRPVLASLKEVFGSVLSVLSVVQSNFCA
jgi:hypothetical protein